MDESYIVEPFIAFSAIEVPLELFALGYRRMFSHVGDEVEFFLGDLSRIIGGGGIERPAHTGPKKEGEKNYTFPHLGLVRSAKRTRFTDLPGSTVPGRSDHR